MLLLRSLQNQFSVSVHLDSECCKYLWSKFPGLPKAKLKEVIFVGPDIEKL